MDNETDIFEAIADILESKLGIKARFISAASPSAQDKFTLASIARNAKASFLISNERLVFPITIQDDFWGAFFIQGADKYTVEQVSKIQNMITRALTIEEENLIQETESKEVAGKHLLIQSSSYKSSHEAAFAQHEKSARFAFFNASCVSDTNFDSIENMESLGPVTVWINELQKLNATQIQNIKQFLSLEPSAQKPLLVVSSSQSLSDFFTDHTVFIQHEAETRDNLIWFDQALKNRNQVSQDPTLH